MGSKNFITKNFSLIDLLNIAFFILMTILFLSVLNQTPYKPYLIIVYPLLLAFIVFSSKLREKYSEKCWIKVYMLISIIIFFFSIFETFFMILPYFNTNRYDTLMAEIDFTLLGTNPTVWMEQFINPFLTEIMYVLYFFYFPMPLIALGLMYKKKMYSQMEVSILMLLFCYYISYFTYFLVPVHGPRFFLENLHSIPLTGYILSEPIYHLIDILETNKFDCFPSLHTGILLVTMVISFKYNRKLFRIYFPIAIGILISLVYLRYHYVIDMIAGTVFAIISCYLPNLIYKKYNSRFISHFGVQDEKNI